MGRGGGRTEEMKEVVERYRSAVARGELVLKRSVYSKTGFTNIITIKGKFQARLQVPGDGRGGTEKRKQYSLPGLFDTAEDAAIFLAAMHNKRTRLVTRPFTRQSYCNSLQGRLQGSGGLFFGRFEGPW